MDILDTDLFWILGYHAYLDTYMDPWIHGYPFSLDTWILGYFGYQIFSLSRFWISYPSIRIFLDNFLNYHKLKKGNQIQVLILCSIYVYFFPQSIKNRGCSSLISYMEMQFSAIWAVLKELLKNIKL